DGCRRCPSGHGADQRGAGHPPSVQGPLPPAQGGPSRTRTRGRRPLAATPPRSARDRFRGRPRPLRGRRLPPPLAPRCTTPSIPRRAGQAALPLAATLASAAPEHVPRPASVESFRPVHEDGGKPTRHVQVPVREVLTVVFHHLTVGPPPRTQP